MSGWQGISYIIEETEYDAGLIERERDGVDGTVKVGYIARECCKKMAAGGKQETGDLKVKQDKNLAIIAYIERPNK